MILTNAKQATGFSINEALAANWLSNGPINGPILFTVILCYSHSYWHRMQYHLPFEDKVLVAEIP